MKTKFRVTSNLLLTFTRLVKIHFNLRVCIVTIVDFIFFPDHVHITRRDIDELKASAYIPDNNMLVYANILCNDAGGAVLENFTLQFKICTGFADFTVCTKYF